MLRQIFNLDISKISNISDMDNALQELKSEISVQYELLQMSSEDVYSNASRVIDTLMLDQAVSDAMQHEFEMVRQYKHG